MPAVFNTVGTLTASLTPTQTLTGVLSAGQTLTGQLYYGEELIFINTVFNYKGSVATLNDLPVSGSLGDCYLVESESSYYAWQGERWQDVGAGTAVEELTSAQITALQGLVQS